MPRFFSARSLPLAASGLLMVIASSGAARAQEYLPDPALSLSRSANIANGGIESEWLYHRRASLPSFQPRIIPISKFAGGAGYCTPVLRANYYGCDRSGCGCR